MNIEKVDPKTWAKKMIVWCKANRHLVIANLGMQAFASVERKRVDAYIQPIFEKYGFREDNDFDGKCKPSGVLLTSPSQLYLSKEESRHVEFYEECAAAHRQHGWTGNVDHCPALVAENNVIKAEQDVIDAANGLMGLETDKIYGKNREQLLHILIGACLHEPVTAKEKMASLAQAMERQRQ